MNNLNYNTVFLTGLTGTNYTIPTVVYSDPTQQAGYYYTTNGSWDNIPANWPAGVPYPDQAASVTFIPPPPPNYQPDLSTGPIGGYLSGEYGPAAGVYAGMGEFGPLGQGVTLSAQARIGFAATPGGRAVCAWCDPLNNSRITISIRDQVDGEWVWMPPFATVETSYSGVDVCFSPWDGDAIVVVWAGTDLDNGEQGTINYANMNFHDQHLSDKQTFWGQTALDTPSVTVNSGFTFIAWTGLDSANSLNIMSLTGPNFTTSQIILNEESTTAPRIRWLDYANANGTMYLTWVGTDGQLNVLAFDPDSGNGTKYIFPVSSGSISAPSVEGAAAYLYLMWMDANGTPWICYSSTDGMAAPLSFNQPLGLQTPNGLVVPYWGASLAWDNNEDGLQIAYLTVQPPTVNVGAGNLDTGAPAVSAVNLQPADWGKYPF